MSQTEIVLAAVLIVARSGGEHVAESDAEWMQQLLNQHVHG